MTIQSQIQNDTLVIAQPAAAVKPATRLAYLDNLRAFLIILVNALHTAITYGAMGDWTYIDPAQSEIAPILMTVVTTVIQSFSMGLYFFLSGCFTPLSYDRKGPAQFWKDRLLRLGVPLLVYTFALSRIPTYVANTARGETSESFWRYFARTFITSADEGPTWFLFALLLFLAGYSLWRLASRSITPDKLAWSKQLAAPGKLAILAFGLVIAVLMFLLGLGFQVGETVAVFGIFNLMVVFFVQYILFFIAGILAARNNWLAQFKSEDLRFWSWFSLGMFLMMPVIFVLGGAMEGNVDVYIGGPYWQSAAFMLWIGWFGVSISMTLILWLRGRKPGRAGLQGFSGRNSYGVYLIHPLILVPVSVLMTPVALSPLLKFVIVLPVTVVLCFIVSDVLRRLPGMKSVL